MLLALVAALMGWRPKSRWPICLKRAAGSELGTVESCIPAQAYLISDGRELEITRFHRKASEQHYAAYRYELV